MPETKVRDGGGGGKWTPGPWLVSRSHRGYPYQIVAPAADCGPGKVGTSITRWAAISLPSSDEGNANAHLIAAAPAMAEALRGVLRVADRETVEFAAARAALALAEGGEG